MKKILIAIIATVLASVQISASAKSWEQASKEKKVHNQYTVHDMDKLEIDNIYGKVHINTWDKNEVTIDITVTTKARTEAEAQEILDRISFVMSGDEGSHKVFCKTVLEPQKRNIKESTMEIDYTINTPKRNPIDITNKYGDVYLADFAGKMRMNVSYGGLDMQTISGEDNRIKVAFGSAMVASIQAGTFDISYSNLTIDNAKDVDVTNKFGNSNIGSVQNLKIDQKYGNIELGTAGKVSGNIDYTNIEIDHLQKSIDVTMKYCGKAEFKSIESTVDEINVEAYYSNLSYRLAENANVSMDIATSYSSLKKGPLSKSIELTNVDPHNTNSEHYKGKVGKGEGSMNVNAHYSNINFK